MKTEFLKQFDRDAKNLAVQCVRDDVIKAIKNVEEATRKSDIKGLKKLTGFKTPIE